jgi:hypothetical protein
VEPVLEPRHDADVAAPAADRPEQVRLVAGVDAPQPAVGRDDVRGEQVVDRQAVLPDEVADPAAGRDPADADGAGVAEADRETVGIGGGRDVDGRRAGLGPGRPRRRVDLDLVHVAEVDDDAAVGSAMAGAAVAAAPDGELEARLAGEIDDGGDVRRVRHADDGGRVAVGEVVEDGPGVVVALVAGTEDAAVEAGAEVVDVEAGSGHGHGDRHRWFCLRLVSFVPVDHCRSRKSSLDMDCRRRAWGGTPSVPRNVITARQESVVTVDTSSADTPRNRVLRPLL